MRKAQKFLDSKGAQANGKDDRAKENMEYVEEEQEAEEEEEEEEHESAEQGHNSDKVVESTIGADLHEELAESTDDGPRGEGSDEEEAEAQATKMGPKSSFVEALHNMVFSLDATEPSVVSWMPGGESFYVHDTVRLPCYGLRYDFRAWKFVVQTLNQHAQRLIFKSKEKLGPSLEKYFRRKVNHKKFHCVLFVPCCSNIAFVLYRQTIIIPPSPSSSIITALRGTLLESKTADIQFVSFCHFGSHGTFPCYPQICRSIPPS